MTDERVHAPFTLRVWQDNEEWWTEMVILVDTASGKGKTLDEAVSQFCDDLKKKTAEIEIFYEYCATRQKALDQIPTREVKDG